MKKKLYIAPEVEVLEIKIEQGFAQTGGGAFNVPNGGNNGDTIWG